MFRSQKLVQLCYATCLNHFLTQAWTSCCLRKFDVFGPFLLVASMLKPLFYGVFFSKNHPKFRTLYVNTNALTEKMSLLSAFLFLRFMLCPSCLFWRGMKNKKTKIQKNNKDHKMQTRKPLSLVAKKKADNTDIKQCNFIL